MAEPVTVIVPTIGRTGLLAQCLEALAACAPAPVEVIVVDQSGGDEVATLVDAGPLSARLLRSAPPGISRALNHALAAASHDRVLVTHDDCVVRADWVGAAAAALASDPGALVTGRVLPGGPEPRAVPSTITGTERRRYRGWRAGDVLYPSNMALSAAIARGLGGFDERFTAAAEDNDFCYRWLRSGRSVLYEPELVVWHQDWRTPAELGALYRRYWRAQGHYYAKHIRGGDPRMVRFLARDARWAAGGLRALASLRRPDWPDGRREALTALPAGLVTGLRTR
jgi:GT2 family glycosyltransferase